MSSRGAASRRPRWLLALPAIGTITALIVVPYVNIVVMSFRIPSTSKPYLPGFTLGKDITEHRVLIGRCRRDRMFDRAIHFPRGVVIHLVEACGSHGLGGDEFHTGIGERITLASLHFLRLVAIGALV